MDKLCTQVYTAVNCSMYMCMAWCLDTPVHMRVYWTTATNRFGDPTWNTWLLHLCVGLVVPHIPALTLLVYWLAGGRITSNPPIYGLNTSGTITLPSACWKFSKIATIIRGTAQAVALSVCTNAVAPPLLLFLPPFLGLPLLLLLLLLLGSCCCSFWLGLYL